MFQCCPGFLWPRQFHCASVVKWEVVLLPLCTFLRVFLYTFCFCVKAILTLAGFCSDLGFLWFWGLAGNSIHRGWHGLFSSLLVNPHQLSFTKVFFQQVNEFRCWLHSVAMEVVKHVPSGLQGSAMLLAGRVESNLVWHCSTVFSPPHSHPPGHSHCKPLQFSPYKPSLLCLLFFPLPWPGQS